MSDPILCLEGLGRDFGDFVAVKSLNLEVPAGALFGLLGPNGAGKTTTISMVAGVLTPSRGRVTIAGADPRDRTVAARRTVGVVPQDLAIYEELSATENLQYFGRLYGIGGAQLKSASDRVLGIAGLSDRAREPVSAFSGGMKRRLNLAVGLLHDPRLLICDEPTVGVDPQSRAHIFDALRELNEQGVTIVYTSHYMEEVEELCTMAGVMDHGELVAMGTMQDLLAGQGEEQLVLEVDDHAEAVAQALGVSSPTGNQVSMTPPERIQDLVKAVEDTGARVLRLERRRSDLESVFLGLTGRELRDEA